MLPKLTTDIFIAHAHLRINMKVKIPPLLLMLLIATVMYLLASMLPRVDSQGRAALYMSAVVLVLGVVIALLAVREFKRVDTTVDPIRIQNASNLVSSGVYRISRNPMYLSFAIILLSLVIYLQSPLLLFGVVFLVVYITKHQIRPEEQFLRNKFGEQYENYARKVRRWL
jgi:protein-S-isoprenylcysteine O-methyltransferase Ste14